MALKQFLDMQVLHPADHGHHPRPRPQAAGAAPVSRPAPTRSLACTGVPPTRSLACTGCSPSGRGAAHTRLQATLPTPQPAPLDRRRARPSHVAPLDQAQPRLSTAVPRPDAPVHSRPASSSPEVSHGGDEISSCRGIGPISRNSAQFGLDLAGIDIEIYNRTTSSI
jgi:hypothetical protein